VHTRSQADELLASYASLGSRIEVIPHGASAAVPPTPREKLQHRHTLKIAPECRLLLFFGMIKRYKGLDVLIDAMPSVLERFGDAHLLIAGEPFYPLREIERHVRRLGISKHVTIRAGYVPASHVQHYFRAADALVAPYVGGGASGVVLGAQANALPVICSRTEGLQDLVEHRVTGLMAEPRSRDSLANAICDALADPEAFSQMGLAAWLRVKRDNSWDTVAAKTVSLYHQARADARHMTRPVLAALR
jgi:glycosyltransferase involved in cell wall biosynthesis